MMSIRYPLRFIPMFILLAAVLISGCQMLSNAGVPGLEPYLKPDPVAVEAEKRHRQKFIVDRSHESLYWLLANKVSNGMMLRDVEELLGTAGEPTTDFKTTNNDGLHQTTDQAYKWGPDTSGYSVVLFFRDGHVSNFNPKDYRTPRTSKSE